MSRQEGSVASRALAHMQDHPQPWRARSLAEAIQADPNTVSTVLSQIYDDGKGPLTRCQVTLLGTERPIFEYRIAENASGAKEVNRPTEFKINTPKRPPRRDELEEQPVVATAKPKRKYTKRKTKDVAPKKIRAKKAARKTPAKRQRKAKLQATAAKLQRQGAGSSPAKVDGFRCALFSDGSLALKTTRGDFELEPEETKHLFAWLEKSVVEDMRR